MPTLENRRFVPFDAYEEYPEENTSIGLQYATTFDELYATLQKFGAIRDRHAKTYTPKKLRLKIEQIRHGHVEVTNITRSYEIRKTVERLLQTDSTYKKYTSGSRAKK